MRKIIVLLFLFLWGCENQPKPTPKPKPTPNSNCVYDQSNRTIVVIDWTGRSSNPDYEDFFPKLKSRPGINFSLYQNYSNGGMSIQDSVNIDSFKESVRSRIVEIYKNITPYDMIFITGEAEEYPYATTLYMLQTIYEDVGVAVGVANIDHGNLRTAEDAAFVLADNMLVANSKRPTLENWINYFANIGAHEIGHTLGWDHSTTWECIDPELPCIDNNRKGLYDWDINQEQLEIMRAIKGTMYYILPNEFRVEYETTKYSCITEGCTGEGCTVVEYDIVNPLIPFPDYVFPRTIESPLISICGVKY